MSHADETKELIRAADQLMRDGKTIIGEQATLAAELHAAFVNLKTGGRTSWKITRASSRLPPPSLIAFCNNYGFD
jgi:hypothetical protein